MEDTTKDTTKDTTFFGMTIPRVDIPKLDIPKFDLPKLDLPKLDLPKFDLPKIDFPKVDRTAINDVTEAVKNAAADTMLTATQTATKVRNSAAHTVTLVREAVGV